MSNRNGKNGNRGGTPLGKKPRPKKAEGEFAFAKDDAPRRDKPRAPEKKISQFNMRLGEFSIDRMSHDGRGISQWKDKTLFIDGALAGERVTARLLEEHSRYAEARADEVIAASPYRQPPPCAHYALCGGCQLQHLDPEQQLLMKQDAVLEQLERWGGVIPRQVVTPIHSASEGYRTRARLGVWYEDDGEVTLGFRQRQSNKLVQIDQCLVLAADLNRLLAPLKTWLTGLRSARAVTHIELIAAHPGATLVLRHTKPLDAADLAALESLAQSLDFTVWLQGAEGASLKDFTGKLVDPRLVYQLQGPGLELGFHPQDFTQVNPQVNNKMVAQAIEWLALQGDERVLDLFCGIGNFTLPLAQRCAEVFGIEAVDSMVERGRENAARANIANVSFLAADLGKTSENRLYQTCGEIDAVLLDPPRDGAKEIISKLPQLSPRRIVYVSCNPATLARDAKVLAEAGYQLDSLGVMDMFPHTAHIESMALFIKSKVSKSRAGQAKK
ncbi:MAG TPA: 23S rRNA (uracil(1939)-C(5))-methyltransferase RlmD [Cellvibrio sp.]|nr:23S rRNA (uracil(1939)-C(5))-methyltransferase RlmD [Cellvibrio sp.]